MNITDRIDFLYRDYHFENGVYPSVIQVNVSDYADLREYLGLEPEDDLTMYHGMRINVIEDDISELELVNDYDEDPNLKSYNELWQGEDVDY